jgi:hypothetical protein
VHARRIDCQRPDLRRLTRYNDVTATAATPVVMLLLVVPVVIVS